MEEDDEVSVAVVGVVDAVEERDEGGDGEGVIEEGEEVLVGE